MYTKGTYVFNRDNLWNVHIDNFEAIFDCPPNVLLVNNISLRILSQRLYSSGLYADTYQPYVVEFRLPGDWIRGLSQCWRVVKDDQ